ncbi:protein involved in gliding motility GldB [Winogradskyella wandonensis]|uniref:Protein involved in gliding motility GldB n=2 Tax=Winogradskyella wandonensis TaxID=1442586 RepID=A0A4R1KLY7_9FLAO|nr:protein involved in gliding motility GldB [Winogradskyella wandonensis]
MKYIHLLFMVAIFLVSCDDAQKAEKEISKIDVNLQVERFDVLLANAKLSNIPSIQKDFPFLFPKEIDSSWIERFNSPLQKQIFEEAQEKFNDFSGYEEDIRHLFQHIKYYDKAFKIPQVITAADYVDYRNKLVLEADLLIINLINYLGDNHEFYQNIPRYFAENMKPSQIIPDVAESYAKRFVYQNQRKTFLDEIIYYGKLLYFKDVMIPEYSDEDKIGYSTEDLKWAKENEAQIWSYFVEKELLFSTDNKLLSRFTVPAPFSKFYLELDNESPPRLGQYIGWLIVRAYAERTNADVMTIMTTESDEIFNKSKYKPKR